LFKKGKSQKMEFICGCWQLILLAKAKGMVVYCSTTFRNCPAIVK